MRISVNPKSGADLTKRLKTLAKVISSKTNESIFAGGFLDTVLKRSKRLNDLEMTFEGSATELGYNFVNSSLMPMIVGKNAFMYHIGWEHYEGLYQTGNTTIYLGHTQWPELDADVCELFNKTFGNNRFSIALTGFNFYGNWFSYNASLSEESRRMCLIHIAEEEKINLLTKQSCNHSNNSLSVFDLSPMIKEAEECSDIKSLRCYTEALAILIIYCPDRYKSYFLEQLYEAVKAMENIPKSDQSSNIIDKVDNKLDLIINLLKEQTNMNQEDIKRLMGSFQFNNCQINNLAVGDGIRIQQSFSSGNKTDNNKQTSSENSSKNDEPHFSYGAYSENDGRSKNDGQYELSIEDVDAKENEVKEKIRIDPKVKKILRGLAPKVGKGRPYRWGFVFQAMKLKGYIDESESCASFSQKVHEATGISVETVRRQSGFGYGPINKSDNKIVDDILAEIEIIELS